MSTPPSPRHGGGSPAASCPERPLGLYDRPFPLHGALAVTYGVGLVFWAALVLWVVLDPPTGSADGRAIVAAFIVLAAILHLGAAPAVPRRPHDEAD